LNAGFLIFFEINYIIVTLEFHDSSSFGCVFPEPLQTVQVTGIKIGLPMSLNFFAHAEHLHVPVP
jgi:hypothetical protein